MKIQGVLTVYSELYGLRAEEPGEQDEGKVFYKYVLILPLVLIIYIYFTTFELELSPRPYQ